VASSFGYFLCSQLYITNSRGRTIKFANSLLNTTVVAFKVHPLRSYAPMPAPSPPFKTILELVSWNGLQSCRCIPPDVIKSSKCLRFNISFIFGNRKKSLGDRSGEQAGCSNTVICVVAKKFAALTQAPTFSRRHIKTHADSNRCHSERDCHRSTITTAVKR